MKCVLVCSPLRATEIYSVDDNLKFAALACQFVTRMGYAPFAPHLFCTQFLDEKNEVHRRKGMDIGLSFLRHCDEIWVFRRSKMDVNSQGMNAEIHQAIRDGIRVVEVLDLEQSGEYINGLILGKNNEDWTMFTV